MRVLSRGSISRRSSSRIHEANEFYDTLAPRRLSEDARRVQRQAFAGLLLSKQYYHYDVSRWLKGDPIGSGTAARASAWPQCRLDSPLQCGRPLHAGHVGISVVRRLGPGVSLYPVGARRSDFAKEQLVLMLREWYMHPNGQIPAYEWAFGDVNPPVHAWAAWRVYKIEQKRKGVRRPCLSRTGLSQTAVELHLVGQPEGHGGQEHF